MKIAELRKALVDHGVRPYAVSIDGHDEADDQYRLVKEGKYCITWVTYYSERGNKVGLREFASEDEACDFILDRVLKDSTRSVGTKLVPVPRLYDD